MRNHGQFVSCVSQTATAFMQQGLISGPQKGQAVSAAARSDIGKPKADAGCEQVFIDVQR